MTTEETMLTVDPDGGMIILPDERGITNAPTVDPGYPEHPGSASSWSDCTCICSGGGGGGGGGGGDFTSVAFWHS